MQVCRKQEAPVPNNSQRLAALRTALEQIDNLYFNRDEYEMSFAATAAAMDDIAQTALEADDNFTP